MSLPDCPITVVLATDSFLVGDGLAALLAGHPEVDIIGRADDHDELVGLVGLDPEAVIVTIRTPAVTTMAVIKTARRLRMEHPEMGIVVISDRGDGLPSSCSAAGRRGWPTSSMSTSPVSTP